MKDLIKISKQQIGTEKVNSVNSREIYEYLEVKTEYAKWIQRAIEKYDFVENTDYIIVKNDENPNLSAGRPLLYYIVTLDMAKVMYA